MSSRTSVTTLALMVSAIALASSSTSIAAAEHAHTHTATKGTKIIKAIAVLTPTAESQVRGVVTFTAEGKAVHLLADLEGLAPGSKHGFHLHEFGDCSAPDATSAGGHFNPTGAPHGAPSDAKHHGGDFGNIEADAEGKAHLDLVLADVSLSEGPHSIMGRGVIVHAQEDDLKTQPTGNAGQRSACGVVGIAKDGVEK